MAKTTARTSRSKASPETSGKPAARPRSRSVTRAAPAPAEAVMYIGPARLGRLHLQRNTVFSGGILPAQVQALAQASAEFASLIVPLGKVGEARQMLRNPKSELARAHAAVARMEV
ncbi:hypothetical protein [Desulfocurvibacter africanus]|uniref:hypothetical protein n=1 Tax=Desulfocurvibacter africanus TaxID=873 RepID=UPI0004221F5C|nr:hypothetical protein [Desulfocurvibacter africanus]